jgi:hypothetical protein
MEFTNPFLVLIVIFIVILIIFILALLPTINVRDEKIKREWQRVPQTMGVEVLLIFFITLVVCLLFFLIDFTLYGPTKQSTTSSFTISGRDQTVLVTVKDKQIGNQTFVFDDNFQLISDNKNVNGLLESYKDENPFVRYTLSDFKKNFVNNKKKTKFKLIYNEDKYINETLFQTITRILSGRKVEQIKIKTSISIKLIEDPDFDYEQK